MTKKTNPNGANQFHLDPRQKLCWDLYINPESETFGNALQSAIKAGYEEETAKRITTVTWFLEKIRRLNLLGKAEKVLEECLEMPTQVLEWEGRGEDAEQVVTTSPALVKVKQDTAKFIASTQGKNDGYSTKSEVDVTSGGEKISAISLMLDDIQKDE